MKIISKTRSKPANPAQVGESVRGLRVLLRLRFQNPQLVSAGQAACRGLCGLCGLLPAVAIERTAQHTCAGEDPRDHGLTAEALHAAADRLYDPDDSRLEPMAQVSVKFGTIRSRLRALADAIEETSQP